MRQIARHCMVAAAACTAVVFAAAASAQILMGKDEIKRMERIDWLSMKKHTPVYPDERVQAYVQCVSWSVIRILEPEFQELDWEVILFDDDSVNAAVNSSGKIAVLSGLLDIADTPDALAAVIGHEIAHATEGHVFSRSRRGILGTIGTIAMSAATGISQGQAGEYVAVTTQLPFAREQESEADLVGLQYMAKAGFDPRAATYLWKNMAAANKASGQPKVAEFMSTHPADDVRLDSIARSLTPALIEFNKARDAGRRPNCSPHTSSPIR